MNLPVRLPGLAKRLIVAALDAVAVNLAVYLSLLLRFDGRVPGEFLEIMVSAALPTTVLALLAFSACGFYRTVWRYSSIWDLLTIALGTGLVAAGQLGAFYFIEGYQMPRSVIILTWILSLGLIGATRLGNRLRWEVRGQMARLAPSGRPASGPLQRLALVLGRLDPRAPTASRAARTPGTAAATAPGDAPAPGPPCARPVLIIGAGDAGEVILREMLKRPDLGLQPIGLADDNPLKVGSRIHGVPVLGPTSDVPRLVARCGIQEIIIAMPSAPRQRLREIIELCQGTGAELKTLPGVYQLIGGRVTVNHVRPVDVEDLLGRDPVEVDLAQIAGYLAARTVLVTGAGGSIGAELCRQIAAFRPREILLLGHGENSIFEAYNDLDREYPGGAVTFTPLIADVRDGTRLEDIFSRHRPQVVFHAAAHKHVPLMELNPAEAVSNNLLGTETVARAARRHEAERLVLVSTDKAVNPLGIMGQSKRGAEMAVQLLSRGRAAPDSPDPGVDPAALVTLDSAAPGIDPAALVAPDNPEADCTHAHADAHAPAATRFCAVRFGNVLGSRGSVVPHFRRQIDRGGPVTVTHPDMTRYFMTIPEAVQLIIQAGALAAGGEVFILDMGQPVRIEDLARQMIRLSGLEPDRDIAIQYTGPRPGEKLNEELITAAEETGATSHQQIFVCQDASFSPADRALARRLLELLPPEQAAASLLARGLGQESPADDTEQPATPRLVRLPPEDKGQDHSPVRPGRRHMS